MATRRSREAALSDLVAGLLDARLDPATERFDAELAAAEEDGRVDPQTAKVLRWWQREAQRALVEHARVVLPPTLLALEQAATGADREVEQSAASWARAAADEPDDDDGTPPPRARRRAQSSTTQGPEPAAEQTTPDTRGDADRDDTDADGDEVDLVESDGPYGDDPADEDTPLTPPADLSEHRRRLLVAGLTRVRTTPR